VSKIFKFVIVLTRFRSLNELQTPAALGLKAKGKKKKGGQLGHVAGL
jgi:hypothetical protein